MWVSAFVMALALGPVAWAQLTIDVEPERLESRPDLANLYERVTRSEAVVIGRVVTASAVHKKWAPEVSDRPPEGTIVTAPDGLFAGKLFHVEVEKTLCRQADFLPASTASAQKLKTVYISYLMLPRFIPSDLNPKAQMNREVLRPGLRYLLFLFKRDSTEQEKELAAEYGLDPSLLYYRAFEGARGAREIREGKRAEFPKLDFVRPAIAAIESFCGAVQSPDVATKIAQLKTLQFTAEPYWRDSIVRAIQGLESSQAK